MLVVLVELGLSLRVNAVEVIKKIESAKLLVLSFLRLPFQIIDDGFGMDFLLKVKSRSIHHEIRPILLKIYNWARVWEPRCNRHR